MRFLFVYFMACLFMIACGGDKCLTPKDDKDDLDNDLDIEVISATLHDAPFRHLCEVTVQNNGRSYRDYLEPINFQVEFLSGNTVVARGDVLIGWKGQGGLNSLAGNGAVQNFSVVAEVYLDETKSPDICRVKSIEKAF